MSITQPEDDAVEEAVATEVKNDADVDDEGAWYKGSNGEFFHDRRAPFFYFNLLAFAGSMGM